MNPTPKLISNPTHGRITELATFFRAARIWSVSNAV